VPGGSRVELGKVLLGIVVAAVLLSAAPSGPAGALELQSVRDGHGRFTISLPTTWQIDQSRTDRALSAKSAEPPGTPPDSVEVFIRDMAFPVSPEACAGQVAWAMRITIHQWTTLSEGPDSIGGLPAYSRTYTWHVKSGEEHRSLQTCVPVGRRVFVIIGTTMNTPERIAQIFPELTRMIGTFRPASAPDQSAPGQNPSGGGTHN
jgi:hypothetical protein